MPKYFSLEEGMYIIAINSLEKMVEGRVVGTFGSVELAEGWLTEKDWIKKVTPAGKLVAALFEAELKYTSFEWLKMENDRSYHALIWEVTPPD